MPKYERYQDYVIRDGRLVGEFEQMYRDYADPWHATTSERFASDKAVGINLLTMLKVERGISKVVELGCGLGHYAARIADVGLEAIGVDISSTAIESARRQYPGIEFVVGKIDDYDILRQRQPDVVVMAEITWYVLNQLRGFLEFLRSELPNTYVLHLLTTYPRGAQKYGTEFFSDLAGAKSYFAMQYIESGEVQHAEGTRTWFLGTWGDNLQTARSALT